jgi:hypothetical protein
LSEVRWRKIYSTVDSVCPSEINVKSYRNKREFIYSLTLLAVVEIYGNRLHGAAPVPSSGATGQAFRNSDDERRSRESD